MYIIGQLYDFNFFRFRSFFSHLFIFIALSQNDTRYREENRKQHVYSLEDEQKRYTFFCLSIVS